jgi:hypothetical protein
MQIRPFTDVMIDLETLSTRPNAAIISIGAVLFNDDGLGQTFYVPVSGDGQSDLGFHVDYKTLEWWTRQTAEARAAAFHDPNAVSIANAMLTFRTWLLDHEVGRSVRRAWSHGSGFDLPIVDHAFRVCGLLNPIKYADHRDTRTIYELAGIDINGLRDPATHHNALADAEVQARGVILSRRALQRIPVSAAQ